MPAPTAAPSDASAFEEYTGVYDLLARPFSIPLFRLALRRIGPLPSAAAVLDLGCGPGRELCSLAAHPSVAEAVGVDLSPAMCARARSRVRASGVTATVVAANAANLPNELRDRFDLVLSSIAHHHFSDPVAVARGARSALRAHGRYCIIDYGPERTNSWLAPLARVADPGWRGFLAPSELARLLIGAGFVEVTWSQLSPGIGVAIAETPDEPAQF